jgi:hypothetical protein
VSWHKRLLRPPDTATLTFRTEAPLADVPIVVVGQAGQVMPH